uniref:Uncharacterized protein n=1 Tax=viral metagenome TaxID=1070528 RepID=A0A6M3K367_9ZZZZ
MTILVIVAPEARLRKLAKDVDAALGYPCEGVPIGGGLHCPGPTRTYADPEQAPDGQWEYPADVPAAAKGLLTAATASGAVVRPRAKRPAPAEDIDQ